MNLMECFWDSEAKATTERYFVVDAASGAVQAHALTTEAYRDEEYRNVLTEVGFEDLRFLPSLVGVEVDDVSQSANLAIVAKKPAVGSEAESDQGWEEGLEQDLVADRRPC